MAEKELSQYQDIGAISSATKLAVMEGGRNAQAPASVLASFVGTQLDASGIPADLEALKAGQSSNAIYADTLADLQAVVGTYEGQGAFVTNCDGAGQYRWDGSAWEFLREDTLTQKADKQLVSSMIKNDESYDPVRAAVVFEDGSRSYLEVDQAGRPTHYAARLIEERVGPISSQRTQADMGYSLGDGYEDFGLVLRYPDNHIALALDRAGNPITRVPRFSILPAAAYGDSTTAGADLVNPSQDRWSRVLERAIGFPIWNFGVSGERSDEIQFRSAAISILATVSGGVVAGSGNTTLSMDSVDPLRASTSPRQVIAICENGQRIHGRLSASGANRIFTRSIPGDDVATSKVRLVCASGLQTRDRLLFLGMGVNDEPAVVGGSKTVSEIKAYYQSAVSNLSPDNPTFVIWGLLDRGPSEAADTPVGDYIREMERWLADTFGSSFCAVRQFLASPYAFDVAGRLTPGFLPTPDDTDAVATQTVPPSFRVAPNSVHLNVLGHKLQAWYMHQHLIARGII